jgi:two-component sensor histidine kinase
VLRLSHAETIEEFVEAVDGRIRALGRAHSLLSESRWQGVDFGRIVNEEIAPFKTPEIGQVAAEGPPVTLLPIAAQSLALAMHELVTNAVKYGALSSKQGRVHMAWNLEGESLLLNWSETGGPRVRKPTYKGFGTRVIAASIEGHLDGKVTFDWHPDGLRCSFTVPRQKIIMRRQVDGHGQKAEQAEVAPMAIAGRRILLVEDEALLREASKEMLEGLGFEVAGPFSNLAQAIAAAESCEFHGAVLDVNIGGHKVYPVADLLVARGIPFIFVTGYSPDSIDRRYERIPVLEKPIKLHVLRQFFVVEGTPAGAVAAGGGADPASEGSARMSVVAREGTASGGPARAALAP